MSYAFYKVLHLGGICLLFATLGGLAMLMLRGGTEQETKPLRKLMVALNGVALVVILVAGFGAMAKKPIAMDQGWPLWIYLKIGLWVVFGGMATAVRKVTASWWFFVLPVLGAAAAYLAIAQPQ